MQRAVEFIDSPYGEFSIWAEPDPEGYYIIGADIAKGLDVKEKRRTSDHSTMCVMRRLPGHRLEQVAEGFLRCEVSAFGLMLAAFGFRYNDAIVNPERNIAEGVVAGLMQANYPEQCWYQPPVSLSTFGAMQSRYFYAKTKSTQDFLIDTTLDYLANDKVVIRSQPLLDELAGLQYEAGRRVKTNGKDRSIALMMSVVVDATTAAPSFLTARKKEDLVMPDGIDDALWRKRHGIKDPPRDVGMGTVDSFTDGEGSDESDWSLDVL